MEISRQDFKYFKDELEKDISYKEKEYDGRIEPDKIIAYYEGSRQLNNDELEVADDDLNRISLNKLFPATNTVVSTLYPANPGFTCKPKREGDEYSAMIAEGALNYYFKEQEFLSQNQLAILNAWFFGFGCVKMGWRSVFKQPQKATLDETDKKEGLLSKAGGLLGISQQAGDLALEEENPEEFVLESEPFIYCVPNKNIIFDRSQPFGKGKRMAEHLTRNLYQVRTCGVYNVPQEFIQHFSTKKDEREVALDLYEVYIQHKNGMYLLTTCKGWDKPLRFDKLPYESEGFPYTLLRLNIDPTATYPVSHMKAAQRIHRELDYILSLQLQHIRKHRSMDLFWEDGLDDTAKRALRANEIGGYGFTKQPPSTVHSHVGGGTIPQDLFAMQEVLMQNLKEILTITGARVSGQSEFDTATQEKIADYGNQLRTATMQDQVNEFIRNQGRKLLQHIKQFGNVEALFKITGMNMQDPQTGQLVTEKWVEFPYQNGLEIVNLKDAIQGEYDIDIDVTNLARRDIGMIRKQLTEAISLLTNPVIAQQLLVEGKRIRLSELVKDLLGNFETLGNGEKYIEEVPQPIPQIAQGAMPGQPVRPEDIPQEVVDQAMAEGGMNVNQG